MGQQRERGLLLALLCCSSVQRPRGPAAEGTSWRLLQSTKGVRSEEPGPGANLPRDYGCRSLRTGGEPRPLG